MIFLEASAEITGAPDLYIKSGSTLRIVCSLKQNTETPVYVFWYHNDRMINYDKERVSVSNDKSISVLQIYEADKTDSGNYSCVPSNAKQANVNVHVLNGKSIYIYLIFLFLPLPPLPFFLRHSASPPFQERGKQNKTWKNIYECRATTL